MSEFNLDIEPTRASRRKRRQKRQKLIYNIVIAVLCAVLVFSIYKIVSYYWQAYSNNNMNEDIAEEFLSYSDESSLPSNSDEQTSSGGKDTVKKPIVVPDSVDIVALQKKYKDAVGWIFSKNGVINYPIVQGDDNSFYASHRPDGSKNVNGSIYMDYLIKPDFSGYNTLLYGHSMNNGSMFRTLLNYKKQSYYDKYPEMYIFTPSGRHKLVIFAAYESNTDDLAFYRISSEAGFDKFVEYAYSRSKIKTDIKVGRGDRLVTLSTCAYSSDDARMVVVGKLIKDDPASQWDSSEESGNDSTASQSSSQAQSTIFSFPTLSGSFSDDGSSEDLQSDSHSVSQ